MNNTFWNYISTLLQSKPRKVILALTLMIFISFTESISLMLLAPILQLIGLNTQEGTVGQLAQFISSIFKTINIQPTLFAVLCIYVLIISIQAVINKWQTITNLSIEHEFAVCLRQKLYQAIANTNWLFFSKNRSSDFTCALTVEIDRASTGAYSLLQLTANSIVAFIYVLLALKLSPIMTALVFLCGMTLLIVTKGKIKAAYLTSEELSIETSSLYAACTEHFASMKTTKSYNTEEQNTSIFSRVAKEVAEINKKLIRNQTNVKCFFDIGTVLILSLFLYISVRAFSIDTAGILLLLFLFARIMPKLSSIQQAYQEIANTLGAFAGIMRLEKLCKEAIEPAPIKVEKIKLQHTIQLRNIFFQYRKEDKHRLFNGLSFTIEATKTTAIFGPSGSGKSTIADLIIGLLIPNEGQVLIDGAPLTPEKVQSWREQIGYVAQDTFLFHDTIKANLLWAYPNASNEEIKQALRLSACEEFISILPKGIETIIGDRGVLLSGGERQRLALARALLRRPSLLILDESTNSLDLENEKKIYDAISKLRGELTILVINHRISTIQSADVIYFLEKGEIVESGSFNELVSKEGRFYTMCLIQGLEIKQTGKNKLGVCY